MKNLFSTFVVILIVLGIAFIPGVRIVDTTEVCTMTKLGVVQDEIAHEGFQIVNWLTTGLDCYPTDAVFFQTGENENKEADYWDYMVEIKTSDGQTGYISFNVLYSVDENKAVYVRSKIASSKDEFNERVIANKTRTVPRNVASGYDADGLYSALREEYELEVENDLRLAVEELGGILLSFDLRDVQFNAAYEAAIEAQQIEQEKVATAKFTAESKKAEADGIANLAEGAARKVVIEADAYALSTVTRATADAKALDLVSRALRNNPDLLTYEYIQKLAPNIDVMMLPASGEYILPLPVK